MKINWTVISVAAGFLALLLIPATGSAMSTEASSAVMSLSYLGTNNPRGIRNNNPLNLIISSNPWQGKIPVSQNTDGSFEQFESFVWGVRAAIKNIINYIEVKNLNSIEKIIECWAPRYVSKCINNPGAQGDNSNAAVDNYINIVVQKSGISKTTTITANQATLQKIVTAMAYVENGKDVITDDIFNVAYSLI